MRGLGSVNTAQTSLSFSGVAVVGGVDTAIGVSSIDGVSTVGTGLRLLVFVFTRVGLRLMSVRSWPEFFIGATLAAFAAALSFSGTAFRCLFFGWFFARVFALMRMILLERFNSLRIAAAFLRARLAIRLASL